MTGDLEMVFKYFGAMCKHYSINSPTAVHLLYPLLHMYLAESQEVKEVPTSGCVHVVLYYHFRVGRHSKRESNGYILSVVAHYRGY